MNKLSSIAPMCSNLGKISPISLTRVLWSLNYCKRNGSQSLPDVSGNLGALGGSQLLLHFWSPFALFFSGIFYKVFLEDGSQGFREENSGYSKFSFLSKNYLSKWKEEHGSHKRFVFYWSRRFFYVRDVIILFRQKKNLFKIPAWYLYQW